MLRYAPLIHTDRSQYFRHSWVILENGSRIQNCLVSPDDELDALFIDEFQITVCDQHLVSIITKINYYIAESPHGVYSLQFPRFYSFEDRVHSFRSQSRP